MSTNIEAILASQDNTAAKIAGVKNGPLREVCQRAHFDQELVNATPVTNTEAMRAVLYRAAIDCPHEIDRETIVMHFDPRQDGINALAQLGDRLARAALAQSEQRQRVPIDVEFAAAYLDGVMEVEHPEIQAKWKKVRAYLNAAPQPEEPGLPHILQRQAPL